MKIHTTGRTDLRNLFAKSGLLSYSKLPHTPFLVFVERDGDVYVEIANSADALKHYPLETPVMVQWRGEWSSDFFQMTVGDVLRALVTKRIG